MSGVESRSYLQRVGEMGNHDAATCAVAALRMRLISTVYKSSVELCVAGAHEEFESILVTVAHSGHLRYFSSHLSIGTTTKSRVSSLAGLGNRGTALLSIRCTR